MPSIYTNLKSSDRKHIRTEKARIRREFLDVAKQEEKITELYKRMVGKALDVPEVKKVAETSKVVKETKVTKAPKEAKAKVKKAKAK